MTCRPVRILWETSRAWQISHSSTASYTLFLVAADARTGILTYRMQSSRWIVMPGHGDRSQTLSQFVMEHPAAHTNPGDFEPDETFYSMIAVRDTLYVVGPNHGQVL